MSQTLVYTLGLFVHLFILEQASLHWTWEVVEQGKTPQNFQRFGQQYQVASIAPMGICLVSRPT